MTTHDALTGGIRFELDYEKLKTSDRRMTLAEVQQSRGNIWPFQQEYRDELSQCYYSLAYNDYELIPQDPALSEGQRKLLNRLANALVQTHIEMTTRQLSCMRLTIGDTADLSKVEFDVLERIYTAIGAEMGRRGASTEQAAAQAVRAHTDDHGQATEAATLPAVADR